MTHITEPSKPLKSAHGIINGLIKTVVAFIAIVILIGLGRWQLHRAAEKTALRAQAELAAGKPVASWQAHDPLPLHYDRIQVMGCYQQPQLLLDNQYYQHQWGYDVLTPLDINGEIILVDRGWVKGDITRRTLPSPPIPKTCVTIKGSAYYPSGISLGKTVDHRAGDMVVIEQVDVKIVRNILHKPVYPFIMRLDPMASKGYVRDWSIFSVSPTRHRGYAAQWFLLAVVVFVMWVASFFKKKA